MKDLGSFCADTMTLCRRVLSILGFWHLRGSWSPCPWTPRVSGALVGSGDTAVETALLYSQGTCVERCRWVGLMVKAVNKANPCGQGNGVP